MPPTSPPLTRADASSPAPAGAQDIGGAPPHERILLAARDLFCRDGIHATGIDRILQEASASKMTLYSRFGSKEALLREVLALEGAEWRAAFFASVEAAGPGPAERLHAVIPALRTWFIGERFYGCAFMNAAAEHAKGRDARTPWLREMTQEHHGAILAYLAGLAEAAGYAEPGILARQVLLVMDGAIAAMMVGGDTAVLDISALTLRAVLAQPGA
jgi:AcrR family transcriptional regulator